MSPKLPLLVTATPTEPCDAEAAAKVTAFMNWRFNQPDIQEKVESRMRQLEEEQLNKILYGDPRL